MSIVETIILAIIEGITEFLPVSSTGHIIIGASLMGIVENPFTKVFIVAIQFGAILSVVVLYWRRFMQSFEFYLKLGTAFLPAAVIGLLFSSHIDFLLERVDVVGFMLIIGGIIFLFIDKLFEKNEINSDQQISFLTSLKIGFFQCLALVPGVSRSAATIIGGLTQRLNKKTAAEFSFFLAVPTMFAAAVYKIYSFLEISHEFSSHEIYLLIVGNVVSFIVALIAIKSFIAFLTRHGFKVFGYYRIIVGAILLTLYYSGVNLTIE